MLVKKQSVKDNSQWLEAWETCTDLYSERDIRALEGETISRVERVTKGYKKIALGWVAGKDSLALEHLMRKTGVSYLPIIWRGVNEYPAMSAWIAENKPMTLIEEVIDKYSLEFLEAHPDYLFCQNGTRQNWMSTKWARQTADLKKHGFDLFITGRRLKDGNRCGTAENEFLLHKPGCDHFSPLGDWYAEQLLAYLKYNEIDLPPFYKWDRGFLIGSIAQGEWTERACLDKSVNEVWAELYEIDPSIVTDAANVLTSAREYLKGVLSNGGTDC